MILASPAEKVVDLLLSKSVLSPVVALIMSCISGALLFSAFGIGAADGFYYFVVDPLRDTYGLSELLLKISPILLCTYGLIYCFKAGVWNIGAEGQYLSGAIVGGWMALAFADFDVWFALPLIVVMGVLGGALCASVSAFLKIAFGVNVLLTTIMLNYVSVHLLMHLVNGPLKDPNGFSFPESAIFSDHVMLPTFFADLRLNVSIAFPICLLLISIIVFKFTRFGYELAVVGASPKAAKNAGIPVNRHSFTVLLISGACAGLAGVSEVTGPVGQLIPQLSVGYGYTAIICAYLGRMHPVGVILAAILLGLTVVGAESLQLEFELPSTIAAVFQGLVLFFLLASDYLLDRLNTSPKRLVIAR